MRRAAVGEINGDAFDRFSFLHGTSGVVSGMCGSSWQTALAIAVGWELVEDYLKDSVPEMFPSATADTLDNAIGDVVAMMLGWALGKSLRRE